MARIDLLPTTHGDIRNNLNTMLTDDVYRQDHLVWFDVEVPGNGGGSVNDPFNVWANLTAYVGASPAEQFSVLFMPQTCTDFEPAPNISVNGIGAGRHNIITNVVNYNNTPGYNGALSDLTFTSKVTLATTDNATTLVKDIDFANGFDISTLLIAGTGGIRGTNSIFAGAGGTKFACPIVNLTGCLFNQDGGSITLIDNTGATAPDVMLVNLTNTTFNNEFRVTANTGIVNVIMLNSLILTNTMLFNTSNSGVINLTVDETTYTQMQGISVDFTNVVLTVLSQNGGTGFVPFYWFSDAVPDQASTMVQADDPNNPTNWDTTKTHIFNTAPDQIPVIGTYEISITWTWSMTTTTREAYYRVLVNGAAILPNFYKKEIKDADDTEFESLTIPYVHVAAATPITVVLQFLVEAGAATTLTTRDCQFIVERKQ